MRGRIADADVVPPTPLFVRLLLMPCVLELSACWAGGVWVCVPPRFFGLPDIDYSLFRSTERHSYCTKGRRVYDTTQKHFARTCGLCVTCVVPNLSPSSASTSSLPPRPSARPHTVTETTGSPMLRPCALYTYQPSNAPVANPEEA